jgi:hypothetical protein
MTILPSSPVKTDRIPTEKSYLIVTLINLQVLVDLILTHKDLRLRFAGKKANKAKFNLVIDVKW